MDLKLSPEIMKHYEFLQDLGVFDIINQMSLNSNYMEEILQQASDIFTRYSVDEIINYVVKCFSDKFIPTDLTIILNQGEGKPLRINAFKNLKATKIKVDLTDLVAYEKFFISHPHTIYFPLLQIQFEDKEALEKLNINDPQIIVPIIGISGLQGLILFGSKILDSQYSVQEITYIDHLMRFTSIAIQNDIHYRNSVTDSKTGVFNHSFFMKRVREELAKKRRYGWTFAILIMDIDLFKHCNDTYGHMAGDQVLYTLAHSIQNILREEDVFARFGGEEFTVLLSGAGMNTVWAIAERIRKKVESLKIKYHEETIRITISIGCCSSRTINDMTADDMIKCADSALYQSKENGRNRTTLYKPGLLFSANQKRQQLANNK